MSGAASASRVAVSSTSIASSAAGRSDGIAIEQPPPRPRFARTFAAVMRGGWWLRRSGSRCGRRWLRSDQRVTVHVFVGCVVQRTVNRETRDKRRETTRRETRRRVTGRLRRRRSAYLSLPHHGRTIYYYTTQILLLLSFRLTVSHTLSFSFSHSPSLVRARTHTHPHARTHERTHARVNTRTAVTNEPLVCMCTPRRRRHRRDAAYPHRFR